MIVFVTHADIEAFEAARCRVINEEFEKRFSADTSAIAEIEMTQKASGIDGEQAKRINLRQAQILDEVSEVNNDEHTR